MPTLYASPSDCCGCGTCVAACPQRCINMARDDEGFDYPVIDHTKCIDCGRCEAVCPWTHEPQLDGRQTPPDVHAAWSLDDEIRRQSSSGGVFSVLATHILAQGGAVVGAAFTKDYHAVEHEIVENLEGLAHLRGSKYVQSAIPPGLFQTIAEMLRHGRMVLFSGCPCQVAGLLLFLGPNQKTLITCDLVCHGVPSPGWFRQYCEIFEDRHKSALTGVCFRDKKHGWNKNSVLYSLSNRKHVRKKWYYDFFFWTFCQDYCLRMSCYNCRYARKSRCGDFTIGDYWGAETLDPNLAGENLGISLLVVGSIAAQEILESIKHGLQLRDASLANAAITNPTLNAPTHSPTERMTFFRDTASMEYERLVDKYGLPEASFARKLARVVAGRTSRIIKSFASYRTAHTDA